jgi:hypothetical protein
MLLASGQTICNSGGEVVKDGSIRFPKVTGLRSAVKLGKSAHLMSMEGMMVGIMEAALSLGGWMLVRKRDGNGGKVRF